MKRARITLYYHQKMMVAFKATIFLPSSVILASQQQEKKTVAALAAESEVRYEEGLNRTGIYY